MYIMTRLYVCTRGLGVHEEFFFLVCVNILKFYLFSIYVLMQLTVELMMEFEEDKEAKSVYT